MSRMAALNEGDIAGERNSRRHIVQDVLAGLGSKAEIVRDSWGVPHIRAASADDVFFLNGFVHARDRLWQMDAARRRAVGRYAEWLGPSAVPLDILSRRLGIEEVSRRDAAALSHETRAMLERYAAGVNSFIERGDLPPEYDLLGERPEAWEPWHCVAVMRQRGLLMGSIWFKLWRAAALRTVGAEAVPLLRYDDGGVERFVVPQDARQRRWIASLEELAPAIEALGAMASDDAMVGGSNNLAVDGRHTASGKPMIAGDPHRAFEIPGMYAQLHLTCDEFDALGFSVPGVPAFPHFAHTGNVAWCVTHAFADIHDLYVERFDVADPRRYEAAGAWLEAGSREETIKVRGAADETVRVVTTRHGPVIVGEPETGYAVTLRSVQTDPTDRSLDCLLPMMKAGDVKSFYEATRGWGVIDHNLVAADVGGNIGVSVRAIVPERDRVNGWLPVPGWTDDHEWRGMIPFERMPREINPDTGRIVTANNRTVPDDWPDYICTDCHPTTRANRIGERLSELQDIRVEDLAPILVDQHSAIAREMQGRICAVAVRSSEAASLQALIADWDGEMNPSLRAPTAYYLVRQEMTRILARKSGLDRAAQDPFARPAPGVAATGQLWWTLPNLLRAGDTTLLGGDDWDGVIAEALETVAAGEPVREWGLVHRPTFVHPLAAMEGGFAAPSSATVGGDGDCVCANGAYPATGPAATYGAVARYVFDLADWDNSRWVVFHGASGNPQAGHYSDQNEIWARGGLVPAPYTTEAVDSHAERVERFTPASAPARAD